MSAFVTDGEQRSALAVTRALGRAGVPVTVGETQHPSLAGSSRHCQRAISCPSAMQDPKLLSNLLLDEIRRGGYRVVIPMTDITTQIVADLREELAPAVAPIPASAQVRFVQDKREVLLLARKLGIPCPATHMLCERETVEDVASQLTYPVVIKPRWSRYYHNGRLATGTVQYANNASDLIAKYHALDAEMPRPLVQEFIPGEGRGVFLLHWNGDLKAAFCHRRLREKPPSGGVSVLCQSIALDEHLLEQSLAILKAMDWQGVAMVEYKIDRRDNVAKLMEINGRFWGSLQLAIDAGVNFPLMLYRLALGEKVLPQLTYQTGVMSRWLLGDLDHLIIRLTHAENGSATGQPSRLRACLDFFTFHGSNLHYDVLDVHDARPGWVETKQYLHQLFGSRQVRRAS